MAFKLCLLDQMCKPLMSEAMARLFICQCPSLFPFVGSVCRAERMRSSLSLPPFFHYEVLGFFSNSLCVFLWSLITFCILSLGGLIL